MDGHDRATHPCPRITIQKVGPWLPFFHQKYRLKRRGVVWRDLAAMYPDMDDLVKSTAAARANAWASNFGSTEQRAAELPLTGLSDGAQLLLR